MLEFYIASTIAGGVFVLLSVFSGLGGDGDIDKDVDKDFDKDFDKDIDKDFDKEVDKAMVLTGAEKDLELARRRRFNPFLSFKFYTFTSAFGGVTGTALTLLSWNPFVVGGVAAAMGLGAGLGMTYTLHVGSRSVGGRVLSEQDYVGLEGKITLPVLGDGSVGKVRFRLRGQLIEMPAIGDEGTEFKLNQQCFVLSIDDGVAKIVSADEMQHLES